MNDDIMESAFADLATQLEAQDAELLQEVADLWDVWQWATSGKRHWCDDVKLHLSGVHIEITEPKEGRTKAERRPEIHRFTHYTSTFGSNAGAVHAAAEWIRQREGA